MFSLKLQLIFTPSKFANSKANLNFCTKRKIQQFMQILEAPDEHGLWTLGVEALAEKKVS